MLEKEIKLILSQEEYDRLTEALTFDGELLQVNHYYHSDLCSERRISVRVREVEGKALLQVKLPVSTQGSLAVREERERELEAVPERITAGQLTEICGIEDEAVRLGSLTTLRKLSHQIEGVEFCLDKNDYLGVTDYELEAEYTGDYPKEAVELLESLGIPSDRPAKGKYARFWDKLYNI